MRTPHAVPNDNDSDGHAIISLRRVMAQLRWDHAAMRRRTVWLVAGLPLFALLLAAEAIAGLTSVSVGLNNRGGTKVAAALMSAVNISAGGSFAMTSAVSIANYNQRAWQLLGLANDPNAMLDVELTLNAAATASGAIAGFIKHLVLV